MTTRLAAPVAIVLAVALALTLALLMARGIHAGAAAPHMHYFE